VNEREFEIMAVAEERHWWYLGLRDLVSRILARSDLGLRPGARVLDAGCGTGANLRLLQEVLDPGYLGGFDFSPSAVAWARRKAPSADVYQADICNPVLNTDRLDLVVSLDVLCIPGSERSRGGLEKLVSALRPGGILIVDLPAYNWLRSEHDVATHTHERFTAPQVGALFETLALEVVTLSYRIFWLLPLIVAARLPRMTRARTRDPAARSDLHHLPATGLSRILFAILRQENRRIAGGRSFPWGTSVFAVGRKPQPTGSGRRPAEGS
jgi:SAM-dependent methyltransferase